MLQSVRAGSVPLAQGAFVDQLNQQVFFLGEGRLRSHHLLTQE